MGWFCRLESTRAVRESQRGLRFAEGGTGTGIQLEAEYSALLQLRSKTRQTADTSFCVYFDKMSFDVRFAMGAKDRFRLRARA